MAGAKRRSSKRRNFPRAPIRAISKQIATIQSNAPKRIKRHSRDPPSRSLNYLRYVTVRIECYSDPNVQSTGFLLPNDPFRNVYFISKETLDSEVKMFIGTQLLFEIAKVYLTPPANHELCVKAARFWGPRDDINVHLRYTSSPTVENSSTVAMASDAGTSINRPFIGFSSPIEEWIYAIRTTDTALINVMWDVAHSVTPTDRTPIGIMDLTIGARNVLAMPKVPSVKLEKKDNNHFLAMS